MCTISNEIIEAAKECNLHIDIMDNAFSHNLLVEIKKQYMNFKQIGFLWENLIKASYISDPYGWNKISSFVGEESCYLLIFDGKKKFLRSILGYI